MVERLPHSAAAMSEETSDEDIERLAARLAANQSASALTLEGVDGLFCALVASPTLVRPSEYLPVILGGNPSQSPAFSDAQDAQATLSLLMHYWNAVVADFRSPDHIHFPYIEEPGTDDIPGRDWARGFMLGTRLAPQGWSRLFQEENEGQVISIAMVAGEIDPEWPKEPLTAEKRDELLKWMIAGAARAYRYFETDRRESAQHERPSVEFGATPQSYTRPGPKVGRNDLCPCGSGKKFKRCCGSPDRGPSH
jgi:uncharacterized protein